MDFSLISSLVEQAAMAIKNSDAMNLRLQKSRIDSDLKLASEVQELFLTQKFPEHKGIELDAKYLPSAQVGGDFYDFYKLSSNKFCSLYCRCFRQRCTSIFTDYHLSNQPSTLCKKTNKTLRYSKKFKPATRRKN